MKNLFIILTFTIKQALKKKSFWISNIILAILIIGTFMFVGSDLSTIKINLTPVTDEASLEEVLPTNVIISMSVSFLLFFGIYLYGHSIATSIATEKTSRVIETLVTSARPYQIILGKTFGMGLLGILQLAFLCSVTVFSYKFFIPDNLDFISTIMESVSLNYSSLLVLFIYFILGYLLYAFANTVIGATVSKSEDIQIANMPLSILSLASFYLSFFTMQTPESSLSILASYFPFSSAFSMPAKYLTNFAESSEVIVSLLFLLVGVIILAFIAIRIYSATILNYGNRIKIKDLFNVFMRIK